MEFCSRVIRNVAVMGCALIAGYVSVGMAAPAPKVTICHLPPGNPGNVQVITVGAPAVPKHVLLHGDAVCAAGDSDCCADPNGEVCTNVQNDANNCGACGTVCARGEVCSSGVCQCPSGETLCSDVCVNLSTDPNNCGRCGDRCATGAACVSGVCGCPTGETECSGACVSLSSDPNNCGACDRQCPTGFACSDGACACPPGNVVCPGVNGEECVNLATDPSHCGSCARQCLPGAACEAGECV